jgi:hypothetical protein
MYSDKIIKSYGISKTIILYIYGLVFIKHLLFIYLPVINKDIRKI